MNAPAGWYPDPGNAHVTRYWNGDRYTHERHWNGSAWVEPPPIPPPAAPASAMATPVDPAPGATPIAGPIAATSPPATPAPATPAPSTASPPATPVPATPAPSTTSPPAQSEPIAPASGLTPAGERRPNPSPTFWIFMVASAGVALSALLPWVSVSGFGASISSQPGTGGPGVLILFAVGVAAIAWPTVSSPALSKARRIGLIPIVGFLAIAVVTNWSDLADLKDKYNGVSSFGLSVDAGIGFYLYTVCVIALVVALVRVWIAGARTNVPA